MKNYTLKLRLVLMMSRKTYRQKVKGRTSFNVKQKYCELKAFHHKEREQ